MPKLRLAGMIGFKLAARGRKGLVETGARMRKVSQVTIALAVSLLAFAVGRYFFPPAPTPPTGQISCALQLAANMPPARNVNSSLELSRVNLTAQLSNRSEHQGTFLWQADGTARLGDQSRVLSGVVFLNRNNTVRGIALLQDRPGQDGDKLRIMTLNRDGGLDWNDTIAHVRFESDPDKLAHPFYYGCYATVAAAG